MELQKELTEFVRDRWTVTTTRISIPTILIILSTTWGKTDILWLSIYTFLILFIASNSLYILIAQKEVTGLIIRETDSDRRLVAKYNQLRPYAMGGVILSILPYSLF